MSAGEFSFVSQDVFEQQQESASRRLPNDVFMERFVRQKDATHALLLWLENAPDAPLQRSNEKVGAYLSRTIALIDELLQKQLNIILHHPKFQALESSWRNVKYLTEEAEQYDKDGKVKIKLLNCSWQTLTKDVSKATDFDQSDFFKQIYSNEYDNPGGEPFGVIIGDYRISHKPRPGVAGNDIDTLQEIVRTCAAAFSPFITSAEANMFGVDNFSELGFHVDLSSQFEQIEYIKWRKLRNMEDARFLGIAVPRVLMRAPYVEDGQRSEGFKFREVINNPDEDNLWGNAAYPFAATLIRAFCNSGWFGQIRGMQPGQTNQGVVTNLAQSPFETDLYQKQPKPPVDLLITDRAEKALSDSGFIPLSPLSKSGNLVFFSNASAQQPANYDSVAARINAKLSSMMQYILCVSRFAHYIKVMGRDRIGSYATPQACERDLQSWINNYTTASDSASDEVRSRYPLSSARVNVKEHQAKPGHYYSVMQLQPHFQLDQMVSSIKLVTELSPTHYE
ncbi:type VI secretion system contractile sheath large subunit [Pseudoalteromonas ruthenica]|uniref:type VI secretion system contractile sheath large subunit n=1 Tax=Pseudoalteromonas ruthenica TaxID=151081 RepID=UPI00124656A4|nr:type VI secretion system contractile sheath large subunit [Pseudoalteromonas ruthenica]